MRALFVAGHRSEEVWSELVRLPLSQGAADGNFSWIVLLTVRAKDAVQEIGQNLVDRIDEAFGGVESPLPSEKMLEWWQGLTESQEGKVNLIVVQVTTQGEALIVTNGGFGVLAERGSKVGFLLFPAADKWQVLEGQVNLLDKWFWATADLLYKFPAAEIAKELVKPDTEEIQAGIMTKLQESEAVGLAGAIIDFGDESQTEIPATPPEPKVYLKEKSFKRRKFLALGVVILILILAGVWWGGKRRGYLQEKRKYDQAVAETDQSISQAQQWAGEKNIASAAAVLTTTEENLDRMIADLEANPKLAQALAQKKEEVQKIYTQISGEEKAQVNEPWYNLNLLKDGLYGSKLDQAAETMKILDGSAGMVISLGFDKKEGSLTGNGALLSGATLIATNGKRTVVLVPDRGVFEVNTETKTTGDLIKPDATWQRLTGMGLFVGNVYMLDAGASDIYVYPGLTSGVGEKKSWLKPGQTADLSGVTDMAIDGDLWTLDGSGKIRRFRQGQQIDFTVKALEKPITKAAAIVVSQDGDGVYILDQGNKRVVVLDKKGNYVKQYLWDGLAGATDMAVDEKGGGILVLSGSDIYRIPMPAD